MRILALVSIAAVAASAAMAADNTTDTACIAASVEKLPQLPSLHIDSIAVKTARDARFPFGLRLVTFAIKIANARLSYVFDCAGSSDGTARAMLEHVE